MLHQRHRAPWVLVTTFAAALGGGCIGRIGDGDGAAGVPPGPTSQCALDLEARPGMRLTSSQYKASIADLVGLPDFETELEDEPGLITERAVRQLRQGAERVIARRAEWQNPVFPCDTSGDEDLACVDAFIEGFGRKVFRRPVTDAERDDLLLAYGKAKSELDFDGAMSVLLEVMLQAPAFVYLFEDGVPTATDQVRLLTDYEVAARLSYFLWNSTPDDELLAAAAAGELSTAQGLRAAAERMLQSSRAREAVTHFMAEYLQLNGGLLHFPLEQVTKEADLYPEVDAALLAAMRVETTALIERVMFDGSGQFEELWTSREAYVNGPLASLYGVSGPSGADTFEWVTLPEERAGLLTRAAFLTTYSTATVTSPIRRGHWIREEMLCDPLGEPPPNVDDTPLEGGETKTGDGTVAVLTVREATDARTMTDAQCKSCHRLINPLGYAFEGFDAIGRVQLTEVVSGQPVDTEVEIEFTDFDGTVTGAADLSAALAGSGKARACFAKRWLQHGLGGEPPAACAEVSAAADFVKTGNMKDLLVAIVASDAFRYVNVGE